jgi:hypothetical protein
MENTLSAIIRRDIALCRSPVFILWWNGGKNYAMEYAPQDVY